MATPFVREARWVFIGDSITGLWPSRLPRGHRRRLCAQHSRLGFALSIPANAPEIINVGISGNRISDLQSRWDDGRAGASAAAGLDQDRHQRRLAQYPAQRPRHGHRTFPRRLLPTSFTPPARGPARRQHWCFASPDVIWPPAPPRRQRTASSLTSRRCVNSPTEFSATAGGASARGFRKEPVTARPEISWAPDGVHPSSSGHMLIASHLASAGLGLL